MGPVPAPRKERADTACVSSDRTRKTPLTHAVAENLIQPEYQNRKAARIGSGETEDGC